jgi:hypothetical protein
MDKCTKLIRFYSISTFEVIPLCDQIDLELLLYASSTMITFHLFLLSTDKQCTYCRGGISKSTEPGRSGTLDWYLTCKDWIANGKPRHGQYVEANCYDGEFIS